ncbi:MAG: MOSC domain-containing protein [Microbacterium sp.]|nr:MOSC domain-containing protein [Microbacterium sp.]
MPTITALFRHPVKGFTPESCERLVVRPDGRVAGDRVLAFRFSDAVRPEQRDGHDYWPKRRGLSLMDFPTLAGLRLAFDEDGGRVRIERAGRMLVDADLDESGRRDLESAVTEYLLSGPDARRLRADGVLPIRLVGDGRTPRFQDRARGYVSLHGADSVAAVGTTTDALIDDRRFRSNIVIGGTVAWEELTWTDEVRIGEVRFAVVGPIERCTAIMADPDTGERDAPLLRLLVSEFGQATPTLGILLLPVDGGGTVRVGDPVVPAG